MDTWIVAHDFSPSARGAALEAAKDLNGRGGRLILLHVYGFDGHVPEGFDLVGYLDAIEKDARYQLENMSKNLAKKFSNIKVDFEIREGRASDVILAAAGHHDATRIALGTHSRTEARADFIGSVAQRVMRRAEVPALVVKAALVDE